MSLPRPKKPKETKRRLLDVAYLVETWMNARLMFLQGPKYQNHKDNLKSEVEGDELATPWFHVLCDLCKHAIAVCSVAEKPKPASVPTYAPATGVGEEEVGGSRESGGGDSDAPKIDGEGGGGGGGGGGMPAVSLWLSNFYLNWLCSQAPVGKPDCGAALQALWSDVLFNDVLDEFNSFQGPSILKDMAKCRRLFWVRPQKRLSEVAPPPPSKPG